MRPYIFVTAHPSGLMLSADGEPVTNQTVQAYCERTGYTIHSAGFERDYWHIILARPTVVNVEPTGILYGSTPAYDFSQVTA